MNWRTEAIQLKSASHINHDGSYKTPLVSIYKPNYVSIEMELSLPKAEIKPFVSDILRMVGVDEYIVTFEMWKAMYPTKIANQRVKDLPLDDRKLYLCVATVENDKSVIFSRAAVEFLPQGRRVKSFENVEVEIKDWLFPIVW